MARTGDFTCSDPLLTLLHENVVWSMRGNFVDIPTDCPQRDERLGWTGDIQVFAPTAAFLYDCAGPLSSWLADLAAEQTSVGTVPFYVPWVHLFGPAAPTAAWGDAGVIVPWVLYQRFGDAGLLSRQYPSMKAWVDQIASLAGDGHLWDEGFQFGDWLDPAAGGMYRATAIATRHSASRTEECGRAHGADRCRSSWRRLKRVAGRTVILSAIVPINLPGDDAACRAVSRTREQPPSNHAALTIEFDGEYPRSSPGV